MVNITTVLVGCLLVLTHQSRFINGENIVKVEGGIFGEVQEDQVEQENITKNKTNLKLLVGAKYSKQMKSEIFKRSVVTTEIPKQMNDVNFDPKIRTDGYTKSSSEDRPYAVFLVSTLHPSGSGGICSGSLLTLEWVLTAAHCKYKLEQQSGQTVNATWIIAGESKVNGTSIESPHAQKSLAVELIAYPSYDPNNPSIFHQASFDIMLVKTKDKFRLTKFVGSIELSMSPWYKGSKDCDVVGFGTVFFGKNHTDDYTRKTHRLIVNNPCACSSQIDPLDAFVSAKPREDFGFCTGDSGSSLVCGGKIEAVSIAMFKINPESCQFEKEVGCGSAKTTQIFLKTCPFLSWISGHVNVVSKSQIPKTCSSFLSNGSLVQYSSVFVMVLSQIFCHFVVNLK